MTTSHNSTVNSLYLAFYGRPADPEGLKFWAEQLSKAGGDVDSIKSFFADSDEARARFGTDTASERITEIYQQLFNRNPDAQGLKFWSDAIANGHATVADVAIAVLGGAQGTDASLSTLRLEAADTFTAQVEASGGAYRGLAAVEAARVLVRAVTMNANKSDIAALVKATAVLTEVASKTPEVVSAMGSGSELLDLFDTAQGSTDPVSLVQSMAEVARSAAESPNTVAALMRGGGMPQLLKSLPEGTTLKDLVGQLGKGGLKATLDNMMGNKPDPVEPGTDAAVTLEFDLANSPATLVLKAAAGSVTGLGNATTLVFEDKASGSGDALALDYTVTGDQLVFAAPLEAGLYGISWKDDTFTTATGHLAAGSATFAGGHEGVFAMEGFAIEKVTTVTSDVARAAADDVNEAFIGSATATVRIGTGGGQDVVVDQGGTLAIVVDSLASAAPDLILGFDTGNDTIVLEGQAASVIDDNADGKLGWASSGTGKTTVDGTSEAVAIAVGSAVGVGSEAGIEQSLQALNGALDVTKLALQDELLILATSDSGAALFAYVNKDDNGVIDAAELTAIAMFADGAAGQLDIVLVGAPAVPA
ncbi:DUF4214 domain-containing protein [Massilia sp. GCM10020059]|uniref:DUF4214 domain-containing protein n=2 Tax=Massilia TaxID=149698 RepID=A0ABS8IPV1_9BURK|nr:DUF4214 domain-containing protein [Massilia agrisoli]MCC6070640.1 DUF4214 domain-containing protein [Massilia agrisoli]